MRFRLFLLAILAAACANERGEASQPVLGADQGPCTNLDEAACKADPRCQQLYIGNSFVGELVAKQCVLLEPGRRVDARCEALFRDACRMRNDCSLIYWQDLGPADEPVGRPYYKRCASEDMVEFDLDDL